MEWGGVTRRVGSGQWGALGEEGGQWGAVGEEGGEWSVGLLI